MAYIKLTLDRPIVDGETLTFKAPCDCAAVNGIKVYYKTITDSAATQTSKTFVFKDAHGNTLTGLGDLFVTGAYVSVILALATNSAYIQNSTTNGYLNKKVCSTRVDTTLTAANWSNKVYTFTNTAITATSPIEIQPRSGYADLTAAQVQAFVGALIVGGTQAAGSIQLKAMGTAPTIDIPVTIVIRGDL